MAIAACIAAVAIFGFVVFGQHTWVVLRNGRTNEIIAKYPAEQGDRCSIEFTHSVNKTPVRDEYVITEEGEFHNDCCVYYGFGAGVQTELVEGEKLRYEDGAMIIEGIEKYYPQLTYGILPTSTHVFRVNEEEVFLPDLIEEELIMVFTYEWHLF